MCCASSLAWSFCGKAFCGGFEQTFLCARAEVPGVVVGIGGCCTRCLLAAAETAVYFNLFGFSELFWQLGGCGSWCWLLPSLPFNFDSVSSEHSKADV